jgi:8-oxo-dGTP pyrophosphatase MutT (NUDIX family)
MGSHGYSLSGSNGGGRFPKTICSNCGKAGHSYRTCLEPVTSYGIIAYRINDTTWNQAALLAQNTADFSGIPLVDLQFLLIQRRDSIGYIELIRSKYKLTDMPFIKQQVEGTTRKEREQLLTWSFDQLWTGLWGPMNSAENRQYKQEYEVAKGKFEHFRQGHTHEDGTMIRLADVIAEAPVLWETPEWGFPKGRRNIHETDLACALREFEEETGLKKECIQIMSNVEPIVETFVGNNNIKYRHVYYIGLLPSSVEVSMKPSDSHMAREIGAIACLPYEIALDRIRPTTPQKRDVLTHAWNLLRYGCPLVIGQGSR